MPRDDILINVRVNSDQAKREINSLLRVVQQAEQRAQRATRTPAKIQADIDALNQVGNLSASRDKNESLAAWNARRQQIYGARDAVKSLNRELAQLQKLFDIVSRKGPVFTSAAAGLAPTAAQIKQLQLASTTLAQRGLMGQTEFGSAAGLKAALQPLLAGIAAGIKQQQLQTSRDLLLQRRNLERQLATQQKLGVGGGFGSQKTIQDLINVNKQLQELSRTIPNLRFSGAATQIKQLEIQFQNAGFALKRFEATISPTVQKLIQEKERLFASEQRRGVAGQIPQQSNVAAQIVNVQRQIDAGAPGVRRLNAEMTRLTNLQKQYALQWDTATRTFSHHALRIAEGLVIYNAFSRAIEGIGAGFQLIGDIDRDTARLGLVLGGLSDTQADGFLRSLGDIAIETATDFRELLAVTDLVAGALRSIQTDGGTGTLDTDALLGDVEGFQQIIGEFTNVLGPGTNTQQAAAQLTSLFRITADGLAQIDSLGNLTPLERFRSFLDSVVSLGHRSAFEITQLADGLTEAGLNAQVSGFDLRFLTAIMDQLIFRTGQSGREIGTLLRTSLSKLSDPEVLAGFEKIVEGAVETRDAVGNLKDADAILIQLFQAVQSGAVTAEQGRLALQELIPPLNPGAVGFNNQLIASIGAALQEMARDASDGTGELSAASLIIANTLPGRFQSFTTRIQTLLLGLDEDMETAAKGFLNFGNSILGFLESAGPEFTSFSARFLAFTGGALVAIAILERFGAGLLGLSTSFAAFRTSLLISGSASLKLFTVEATLAARSTHFLAVSTRAAGLGMTTLSAQALVASRSLGVMAGVVGGLRTALAGAVALMARFLPLLIAFAAIELGTQLADQASAITSLKEQAGVTNDIAETIVHVEGRLRNIQAKGLIEIPGIGSGIELPDLSSIGIRITGTENETQLDNLRAMVETIKMLGEANLLTEETFGVLVDEMTASNGAISAVGRSSDELFASVIEVTEGMDGEALSAEELMAQLLGATDATQQLTAAQRIAADATLILDGLAEEQGDQLIKLFDRMKEGAISMDEFTAGEARITEAAGQASQLVAAYGDQLRTLIPELASAGQGNVALAETLLGVILQSGTSSGAVGTLIAALVTLAGAQAGVAATVAANPIIIRTIITTERRDLRGGFFEGDDPESSTQRARNFTTSNVGSVMTNLSAQIQALFSRLLSAFRTPNIGGTFTGGGGVSSTPTGAANGPDQSILDIGDLSSAQLQQAIQIALQLQSKIPGATKEASDDIITIIKDAAFLREVRGLDENLLRIAIEELTQQMDEANRLEAARLQQEALLSNLVVNAGPLSALISQPTLFGLGGQLSSGSGLNFDPTQGNFVINVPVELNGLEPALLQQMIYNIISQAIRDALRV